MSKKAEIKGFIIGKFEKKCKLMNISFESGSMPTISV
jgi:hypothetical protein